MWLITGGAGFIGSNLTDRLLTDGETVTIVDDLRRTGAKQNLAWLMQRHGKRLNVHHFDIADKDAVDACVEKVRPEGIIHLAGQVAVTTSLKNPADDFRTNAVGSFNLLDAARRFCRQPLFFYASTNKVYGDLAGLRLRETRTRYEPENIPGKAIDESWPLRGHTPYGCSKLAAEQYVLDFAENYGIRSVVFRHSSMYGAQQYATFDQGWIGWFCLQALRMCAGDTTPFSIAGDGKQVRDVLHADDLVDAYCHAIASIGAVAGQAFNLGGGLQNSLSLLELFKKLEALTGTSMHYHQAPERPGDQKYFVADNRAFQERTGWQPKVSADEGLASALEWARSGGLANAQ